MRACWTIGLLALAVGCLPRGPAPAGQRLLSSRTPAGAEFLEPNDAAPARLLVWEAGAGGDVVSVVDLSATGADGPLRVIARGIAMDQSRRRCTSRNVDCTLSVDRRGRLLLRRSGGEIGPPRAPGPLSMLIRVDPATATTEELGVVSDFDASPSGDRFVATTETPMAVRVSDPDGTMTALADVFQHQFVGDDLFYLVSHAPPRGSPPLPGALSVRRADGTTVAVPGPVSTFDVALVGGSSMLVLRRPLSDTEHITYSLVDPMTLAESPLATVNLQTGVSFSADGRYVVLSTSGDNFDDAKKLVMLDRQTGAMESFDLAAPSGAVSFPVIWRPLHDEAWIVGRDQVFSWRPGAAPTEVEAGTLFVWSLPDGRSSVFTSDGDHFLARGAAPDQFNGFVPVELASADNPSAPRLRLNAPGTALAEVVELGDGQLLIRTWTTLFERGDLQVVDPRSGTIRAIATSGYAATVGSGRALAKFRLVERAGSGELRLVDLVTQEQTLLAENVLRYMTDFWEAPVLGSGTHIAFIVRSSLASPYDGVWLTVLP
jgi:hypothetical protein